MKRVINLLSYLTIPGGDQTSQSHYFQLLHVLYESIFLSFSLILPFLYFFSNSNKVIKAFFIAEECDVSFFHSLTPTYITIGRISIRS